MARKVTEATLNLKLIYKDIRLVMLERGSQNQCLVKYKVLGQRPSKKNNQVNIINLKNVYSHEAILTSEEKI